jgi:septum site-determining protein MinC
MKPISIKGIGDVLQISFLEGDWSDISSALLKTLDERAAFFCGARIALQMDKMPLNMGELASLLQALSEREIILQKIISSCDLTRDAASELGICVTGHAEEGAELPMDTELVGEEAIFFQRTIRSGQSIRFPGHVVVFGDVNPGSEIIAGGHVIIWGRLRGTVHAGAMGDESAVVCALDLSPTQLRIGSQIAISPERKGKSKPEVVRIRDGQLIAETWPDGRLAT